MEQSKSSDTKPETISKSQQDLDSSKKQPKTLSDLLDEMKQQAVDKDGKTVSSLDEEKQAKEESKSKK